MNIKKSVKSEKWFCTLPPQLKMPPAPLPPGKKYFLHPATSIDNASCTPTPWQKNTILSQFIQFQLYGEKDTLAYREMKLLLPGGSGAGGIINWGGRVQKKIFLPGGSGVGGIMNWGGRVQIFFFARG